MSSANARSECEAPAVTSGRHDFRNAIVLISLIVLSIGIQSSFGLVIQEDAYISFRYAANLVAGDGLVYNQGERVEGYTNFLWTLIIAAGMFVGIGPEPLVVILGSASVALGILIAWLVGRRGSGPPLAAFVAPLLISVAGDFNLEAVAGLETSFFAMLVFLCLALTMREVDDPSAGGVHWSGLAGGLAALTRPEGVAVYILLQAMSVWRTGAEAGRWRRRVSGWLLFASLVGAHMVFRIVYYNDLLPNTFYAKTGGTTEQWTRGASYLVSWVLEHPIISALAFAGCLSAWRRRAYDTIFPAGLVAFYSIYVTAVGGDYNPSWRFVHPFFPAVCLLASESVAYLARLPRRLAVPLLLVVLTAWSVFAVIDIRRSVLIGSTYYRAIWSNGHLIGDYLSKQFPPDTVLGVYAAGIVPYMTQFKTYDAYGLTNAIARKEPATIGKGLAGHEKVDEAFVLDRVNLFLPLAALKARPTAVRLPREEYSDRFKLNVAEIPDPDDPARSLWLHYFVRSPQSGG